MAVMKTTCMRTTLLALLACVVGCDPYFQVVVTVPIAQALPSACVQSAFDSLVHPSRANPSNPQGPPLRGLVFVAGQPYADLTQDEYKDSTAALQTSVGRW